MNSILIVDDNVGFRLQVRELLEADGFDVVGESEDGTSGVAAARFLRPDLVLLDVKLPDIEGFEIAQALAMDGTPPSVVLTSSREASAYGPRVAGSRALGFIAKDELSGAAIRVLAGGRWRSGSSSPTTPSSCARGSRAWWWRPGSTWSRRPGTPSSCSPPSREHRPDVAIFDIRIPLTHTDEGLRAAEAIRGARHRRRHPCPVPVRRDDLRPPSGRRWRGRTSCCRHRTTTAVSSRASRTCAAERRRDRGTVWAVRPSTGET